MAANDTPGGVRLVRVPDDRDGQRLDNFLLLQLKGAPRSLVYKLVRSGQVRVNGKRAKADSRLAGGDEVRIPPVKLGEPGDQRPPPQGLLDRLAASIVFEDERILAVNKPSGLATHGGSGISHGLIESLRALRPGEPLELVHRLDRDTSGVLLVAKKRAHNEDVVPANENMAQDENVAEVIDLMAVLRQSLANQQAPKAAKQEKPGIKKTRPAHPQKARARR